MRVQVLKLLHNEQLAQLPDLYVVQKKNPTFVPERSLINSLHSIEN